MVVGRFSGEGGGERGGAQGAQRGTAQGRGAGLPHTGAVWDCAGALRSSGQGSSMQLRKRRSRSCTGALPGAVMGAAAALEAQHAAALGRGLRLRRGAAWSCA